MSDNLVRRKRDAHRTTACAALGIALHPPSELTAACDAALSVRRCRGMQCRTNRPRRKCMCCAMAPHAGSLVRRKQTFLEAIDFAEVSSYKDAKLLSDAKYGKGGRMSKEQAACARCAHDSLHSGSLCVPAAIAMRATGSTGGAAV